MRTKLPLLCLAVLSLAAYAPLPDVKDPTKEDMKKLQGDWALGSLEEGGKKIEPPGGKSPAFVIKGNTLTIKEDGRDEVAEITLDARKKPREINIRPLRGPGGKGPPEKLIPGIYKLEGDTFTICFSHGGSDDRPRKFDTK